MSSPHDDEHSHRDEIEDVAITAAILGGVSGLLLGAAIVAMLWWLT